MALSMVVSFLLFSYIYTPFLSLLDTVKIVDATLEPVANFQNLRRLVLDEVPKNVGGRCLITVR